ncbi:MAG: DinB family protein [Bacteroidetes bacterium]|nr:DinB family protein [Bacteroidota bacterium]
MKQVITLFLIATVVALPASAQEHDNSAYLTAFSGDFDGVSGKLHALGEAIPEDLHDWRPAEGIRSVLEVLNHVSDANFGIAAALGHASDYEATASDTKEGALERLMASQNHVRGLLETLGDADLGESIELFGMQLNVYGAMSILAGHTHEHLGQLIAYARSNGVAPPWSGG